mmetsp:Transcript_5548/g.12093  ORF Transcript_5548/g.12093 Transcript_5548/m.12093 type:complete len:764 (-) Transcript_5548:226-2517(-)
MDSDEEEMKALRSSTRYGGAPKRGGGKADDDDEDDEAPPATTTTAGGSSSSTPMVDDPMRGPPPLKSKEEAEDYAAQDPMTQMMGFMSFGKKKESKSIGIEVHNSTLRNKGAVAGAAPEKKGGIQFGRRITDPASLAGASKRAARAQEDSIAAATAAAAAAAAKAAAEEEAEEAAEAAAQQQSSSSSSSKRRPAPREDEDETMVDLVVPLPGQEAEVLPVTHEVAIQAHNKQVTAIGLDPKGVRMVVGCVSGECKYYDFGGMSEEKAAFRSLEPVADHMVQATSFSTTGGMVLVVSSDSSARLFDRDGSAKPIQQTVKGDMYVRDMQHTKGHTQMLTCGVWHPFAQENWLTGSLDGTLRLWDINATPVGMLQQLPSVHVLKCLDKRNVCIGGGAGRSGGLYPSCCAYSPSDAKLIVGGCSDGSVQVFFEKARYMKPDRILRSAHTGLVTDVAFIQKGTQSQLLVTRSMDHTMKVWDTRMLSDAKGPVKTFDNLHCGSEKSGLATSPCGRWIVTGTSPEKAGSGNSTVRVWETEEFKNVSTIDFGKKMPTKFAWPKALNQLIVGSSTGEVTMLYSPYSSKKGAMHFVGKRAKAKADHDLGSAGSGPIFNMTDPEEIKKFYSTGHGNMQRIRRAEARQAQKTMVPVRPPDKNNTQAATSDSMAFAALALKNGAKILNLNNAGQWEQDSQKALLKYANTQGDSLLGKAYETSQPTQILDWSVDESEGDKRMQGRLGGDFCRKCGQKVCRCVDYSVWSQDKKKQRTS